MADFTLKRDNVALTLLGAYVSMSKAQLLEAGILEEDENFDGGNRLEVIHRLVERDVKVIARLSRA